MNKVSASMCLVRDVLLHTWIGGAALFFFLRFSLTFYHANQAAIRDFLQRIFS